MFKSKHPHTTKVTEFLHKFGLSTGGTIRTDQGGELFRSQDFRDAVALKHYTVKPTGSDAAHQNGKVERLNATFGIMVSALLYSSGSPHLLE